MKFTVKILLAAALLTGSATAFAKPANLIINEDSYATEDREIGSFNAISLSGSFDYYITQGKTESVKVEAKASLLPMIVTVVKNGQLTVYTKDDSKWNMFSNEEVVIRITVKDINRIELSGSGDVYFKGGINANTLRVSLTGSGDITGKVTAKTVESILAGSGDVNISGTAEHSSVRVVGSGDFSGHNLRSVITDVKIVGSGDAEVYASKTLNASVSGSGSIHYSGGPKNISRSIAGSGDISGH